MPETTVRIQGQFRAAGRLSESRAGQGEAHAAECRKCIGTREEQEEESGGGLLRGRESRQGGTRGRRATGGSLFSVGELVMYLQ